MTSEMVIALAREALTVALLLALPPIGIGLLVGLVISVLQATTQIQEQTLTFVPKIVAVFLTILILGPWMLNIITSFAINIFANLNSLGH